MSDPRIIDYQRQILEDYRENLRVLLQQAAHHGGEINAPIALINNIKKTRQEIARIKTNLRSLGVDVPDDPIEINQKHTHSSSASSQWYIRKLFNRNYIVFLLILLVTMCLPVINLFMGIVQGYKDSTTISTPTSESLRVATLSSDPTIRPISKPTVQPSPSGPEPTPDMTCALFCSINSPIKVLPQYSDYAAEEYARWCRDAGMSDCSKPQQVNQKVEQARRVCQQEFIMSSQRQLMLCDAQCTAATLGNNADSTECEKSCESTYQKNLDKGVDLKSCLRPDGSIP